MAEEPPSPDPKRGLHDGPDNGRDDNPEDAAGTPRWVKAFGVVAAVLVLMFVVLHLARGGFRGHGGHG